jgi:hypothetical protein
MFISFEISVKSSRAGITTCKQAYMTHLETVLKGHVLLGAGGSRL